MRFISLAALSLAVVACSPEKTPADQIEEAAGDLVDGAAEIVDSGPPKGSYAPRDACVELSGYPAFRDALTNAVKARDADALLKLADPAVRLDFGGGAGHRELQARLDNPDRHLWEELDELLQLGCAANGQGGLTLPWYFAQDMGSVDAYTSVLITGEEEPVLAEANADAEVLEKVSWDIVPLVGVLEPDRSFQNVKTSSGKSGFVDAKKIRSLLDYRLIANRVDGKWKITAFVAGD